MNVLLFVGEQAPPPALMEALEHLGHLVRPVFDPEAAKALMEQDPPDIAVVSAELAGPHLRAMLKAILDHQDHYRSIIVQTQADTSEERTALYAAGVDDVASHDVTPLELAGRIKAAERIVRLERRLRERVLELESALSRLEMNAVRRGAALSRPTKVPPPRDMPFLLAPAWASIEEILATMCGDYLQSSFQLVAGMALPAPGSPGATVTLTDVEHELRIDMTFFAPAASAQAIAEAFTGDPSIVNEEVVRDVLLELTNSGMGAVKGAFLNDGFKFAGSTPKSKIFVDAASLFAGADAKRALTYRSESSFIHVLVAVRRTPRVRVKATSLREGMIVAHDVKNEAGVLIVAAGTRLTETAAERIARFVPKLEVELADPNAS